MKRITLLLSMLTLFAFTGWGQVIISQYYEGTSSNKWIEITNVGVTAVNLSSPQMYLALFSNASADDPANNFPNSTYTLTGTINPGQVLLFKDASAVLPSYASGTATGVCNFNGDDLVITTTSNTGTSCWANRIDVVGNGTDWGTDKSFYRKANIIATNTTYTPSEWTEVTLAAVNNATPVVSEYLGTHIYVTQPPVLIITEVANPAGGNLDKFVEIQNLGTGSVNLLALNIYLSRQADGAGWADIPLTGTIAAGGIYVIAQDGTTFTAAYSITPDQSNAGISGNGNDGYFIYLYGNHSNGTLLDAYGVINENGTGKPWEYVNTKAVRLRSVTVPKSTWTASEWNIPSTSNVADMTPKIHSADVNWVGTINSNWNTKGNNWSGTYGYIPDASFNVTIPNVTNYPVISSYAACNNLTVNTSSALDLLVNVGLTVFGNLATSGTLTINSNASGNGSLIVKGTATGTATVQRYIAGYSGADNGWHEISSPVNNMLISGSDFDPTATDDLYQWDEPSNIWQNYKQNHFTNFTNGKGYLCAFETTAVHDFVGTLNTGDFTMAGLTKDDWGFNFLGNPYPSALVWNNGGWTLTNVGAVAQIWEEVNKSYTVIAANGIIPSTNGFFVEVASAAGGSVTIPASARTHNSANNYKNAVAENLEETLDLKLTNDANTYYDITRVGFKENATDAWDIEYDAHKLQGGEGTSQLWSVINDENFVYNYLPYVYESFELPINFKAGVNATHHITAQGIDSFFGNSEIYLEDLQTGETINLVEQQMYSFAATTDDAEERFVLHFFGVTSVDNPIAAANESKIYAAGQTVYIKLNKLPTSHAQVDIYNSVGQLVYTGQLSPQSLSSIQLNEKPGIYIVRLRDDNGMATQKVIINN